MSWQLGEADVTKIRKIYTVEDSDGALADVCVPAVGELKTAKRGAAITNAAGTQVRIGSGAFYYQGVVPDADTEGPFLIALVKAGFRTALAYSPVVGASGKIWIPISLLLAGDPVTGVVPDPGSGELQITTNGTVWSAATGTWHEWGYGAYYYEHDVLNLPGFLGLKVTKLDASIDEQIAWGSVDGGLIGNPPAPVGIGGGTSSGVLAGIGFFQL